MLFSTQSSNFDRTLHLAGAVCSLWYSRSSTTGVPVTIGMGNETMSYTRTSQRSGLSSVARSSTRHLSGSGRWCRMGGLLTGGSGNGSWATSDATYATPLEFLLPVKNMGLIVPMLANKSLRGKRITFGNRYEDVEDQVWNVHNPCNPPVFLSALS